MTAAQCFYVPSAERKQPLIWLQFSSGVPADVRRAPGGMFAVTFTGRRSLFRGSYGHLGMFDEEIVVDRMISRHKVEPRISDAQIDKLHAEDPGLTEECLNKLQWGGPEALTGRVEDCYKFDPPRRWRGLAFSGFEMSRFCPEPARQCSEQTPGDWIWLEPSPRVAVPRYNGEASGVLFDVDFIGRRTSYRGSYGHDGRSNEEIIVDRVVSMRRMPLPKD